MEQEKNWTPCDEVGEDGLHHCPYEDSYGGFEDEMCRNCCGVGVDESYPDQEEGDFL